MVLLFSPDEYKKRRIQFNDANIKEIDMTDIFAQIKNLWFHVFDQLVHFDIYVQKAIVNYIYPFVRESLTGEKTNRDNGDDSIYFGTKTKRSLESVFQKNNDFSDYLDSISMSKIGDDKSRGAIVMNCNPFTKGHQYLIEQAAARVDELIVFLVQENKSVFSFEDRMELICLGTEHLNNVKIIPSGRFIISSTTLPGYFTKDDTKELYLDASEDLEYFVQIAKKLEISVRFAGEEPMDVFTNMYNKNMGEYLPKYGISFVEIKRLEHNNVVISASRVRKCMENGDWDTIYDMVPLSTYEFLRKTK